jgi:hypothetical protein
VSVVRRLVSFSGTLTAVTNDASAKAKVAYVYM